MNALFVIYLLTLDIKPQLVPLKDLEQEIKNLNAFLLHYLIVLDVDYLTAELENYLEKKKNVVV